MLSMLKMLLKMSKNFRMFMVLKLLRMLRKLCGVQELISQAAQILGSVDFLGNPMGLLNDVTEGMSELIKYGNVGGLIRNVTHGVSNSAAKVEPHIWKVELEHLDWFWSSRRRLAKKSSTTSELHKHVNSKASLSNGGVNVPVCRHSV